jgi:hypothetical protein
MAKLEPTSRAFTEPDYSAKIPFDQWPDALELAALQKVSDNLDLDSGEIVGGILRWGRGDGEALYVVTKARPLTLQHLAYGDAWQVEEALIRGLNTQDVLQMLIRSARFKAAFSKPKP